MKSYLNLLVTFTIIGGCFTNPGVSVSCNQNDNDCINCYYGEWEAYQNMCRVKECDSDVYNKTNDWCKSCQPNKPQANFRQSKCIDSNCYENPQYGKYTAQWCQDCYDSFVQPDKQSCTYIDCSITPQPGFFNDSWCQTCEIDKKRSQVDQNSCIYNCQFNKPKLYTNEYCQQCSNYKYASLDQKSCNQYDCSENLKPNILTPLWCYECHENHYKFVNSDKSECVKRYYNFQQIIYISLTIFASLLL